MLNSIGKRAILTGTVDENDYRKYVYFVLRTYVEIGARPQELLMYMDELHNHPSLRNDAALEKYIKTIARKKLASAAPPAISEPPEEFLSENTPILAPVKEPKRRWCAGWFH